MARWARWLILAGIIFFVATRPQDAATIGSAIVHFGEKLANGIGTIATKIAGGK